MWQGSSVQVNPSVLIDSCLIRKILLHGPKPCIFFAFKSRQMQYMPLSINRQSWTKMLTHLSKTNAFYRRPSETEKHIFFVDSRALSFLLFKVEIRSVDTVTWLQK